MSLTRKILDFSKVYLISTDALFYLQMLRIRGKVAWYRFYSHPFLKSIIQYIWNNYFVLLFIFFYIEYYHNWRYKIFIDRENHKLKTNALLAKIDNNIR